MKRSFLHFPFSNFSSKCVNEIASKERSQGVNSLNAVKNSEDPIPCFDD